jgi:hypothetical protein
VVEARAAGFLRAPSLESTEAVVLLKSCPNSAKSYVEAVLGVGAAYVINLARRPDRWEKFLQQAVALDIHQSAFTRIEAVDGAQLDLSSAIIAANFNLTRWR